MEELVAAQMALQTILSQLGDKETQAAAEEVAVVSQLAASAVTAAQEL